jgi:polysaccharide biosynthesis protein PslA
LANPAARAEAMAIAYEPQLAHGPEASEPFARRIPRESLSIGLSVTDWALVAAAAILTLAPFGAGNWLAAPVSAAVAVAAAAFAFKAGLWACVAYRSNAAAWRGPLGAALGGGVACGGAIFSGANPEWWLIAAALSALCHFGAQRLRAHWAETGRFAERVVVVGATPVARDMIRDARGGNDLRVLGVFDDRLSRTPGLVEGAPVLGALDDLLVWDKLHDIDRIVIAVSAKAETRVRELIARLAGLPQGISLILDFADGPLDMVGRKPAMLVSGAAPNRRRAELKRLQDLLIGAAMLCAAAPVMLIVALAIKLDSPGPVFFRQRRHGFNNRPIDVWKFRTMRQEVCAPMIVRQTEANDPRITKLGRFLRKTSLDELPQLFNVLAGEMSLVGPRPHAIGMRTGDVESEKLVAAYAHRHRVKPGITGWAQIHGSRGPLQDAADVRERIAYDLDYIDRASFWLDLQIIVRTLPALLGDKLRVR